MHKAALGAVAGRAALIAVMLGGGLLYAGISQAQEVGASEIQAERNAELIAASGGPASDAHLVAFDRDKAAVDVRDDDVAALPQASSEPASQPAATPATAAASEPTPVRRVAAVDTSARR